MYGIVGRHVGRLEERRQARTTSTVSFRVLAGAKYSLVRRATAREPHLRVSSSTTPSHGVEQHESEALHPRAGRTASTDRSTPFNRAPARTCKKTSRPTRRVARQDELGRHRPPVATRRASCQGRPSEAPPSRRRAERPRSPASHPSNERPASDPLRVHSEHAGRPSPAGTRSGDTTPRRASSPFRPCNPKPQFLGNHPCRSSV